MLVFQKFIYRIDLQRNPDVWYLFGDNERRVGTGGQAKEMRGEPNAVGIRTKAEPEYAPSAYWHDEHYEKYLPMIDEDFVPVLNELKLNPHRVVIVPTDGLGTGLAKLHLNAPKTLQYIEDWLVLLADPTRVN